MTTWLLVGLVVLVVVALWLSWTAQRLDRMHHRTELARSSLETQLVRRSAATLELASAEALDPASRLILLDAAHHARNAAPGEAGAAESALSQALRAVLDAAAVAQLRQDEALLPLLDELAAHCAKVELARRFLNDVVVTTRSLRSRRRVRWFRLAGHAGEVATVDLDDTPPEALVAG